MFPGSLHLWTIVVFIFWFWCSGTRRVTTDAGLAWAPGQEQWSCIRPVAGGFCPRWGFGIRYIGGSGATSGGRRIDRSTSLVMPPAQGSILLTSLGTSLGTQHGLPLPGCQSDSVSVQEQRTPALTEAATPTGFMQTPWSRTPSGVLQTPLARAATAQDILNLLQGLVILSLKIFKKLSFPNRKS